MVFPRFPPFGSILGGDGDSPRSAAMQTKHRVGGMKFFAANCPLGGFAAMKKALSATLTILVVCALGGIGPAEAAGPNRSLATVTGTVRDSKGNPLAGALVSLLKELPIRSSSRPAAQQTEVLQPE